jgi:hypothetical protein
MLHASSWLLNNEAKSFLLANLMLRRELHASATALPVQREKLRREEREYTHTYKLS